MGRKAQLLFTNESLWGLKWKDIYPEGKTMHNDLHLYNLPGMVQSKTLIFYCPEKYDVQDTSKPSELVDTGLTIDSQIGKEGHNILSAKTSPVYQKEGTPGFRVKLHRVHECKSRDALDFSGM